MTHPDRHRTERAPEPNLAEPIPPALLRRVDLEVPPDEMVGDLGKLAMKKSHAPSLDRTSSPSESDRAAPRAAAERIRLRVQRRMLRPRHRRPENGYHPPSYKA
jgi:hypothetical protein